jgi:hypothetical protein
LAGLAPGDVEKNFNFPLVQIVWVSGPSRGYQRYVALEHLGQLYCSLDKGFHAKLQKDAACLFHQLDGVVVVAPIATSCQHAREVQVRTS